MFVADAGNRIVWRYDLSGKLKGRIGEPNKAQNYPGFLVTNHYFPLALGADGLLYVVNPRALRVEGFTFGGDLEFSWGKGSAGVEGFFGCCNPACLAAMPDGRFVTAGERRPAGEGLQRRGQIRVRGGGARAVAAASRDRSPPTVAGAILVLDTAAGQGPRLRSEETRHRSGTMSAR